MRQNSYPGKIIRILLLCLCAALLAGTAAAEETAAAPILENGLKYMGKLPDGRILFGGFRQYPGKSECFPRLLCLNTDRTVSWDAQADPGQDARYTLAAVLPDGTVAAVLGLMSSESVSDELCFFTQDGEPVDREMTLPVNGEYKIPFVSESLVTAVENDGGQFAPILLFDWNGNKTGELGGPDIYRYGGMIQRPDGFILEFTPEEGTREEKIVRTDSRGNVLWEVILPRAWTTKDGMGWLHMWETDDGELLVLQSDLMPHGEDGEAESQSTLTALDSNGNILRTENGALGDSKELCMGFCEHEGKYAAVLYSYDVEQPGFRLDGVRICWLDGHGRALGTTELALKPEDFDWTAQYAQDVADGKARLEMTPQPGMISMPDGLWMYVEVRLRENGTGYIYRDTWKQTLVRIPEL